MPIPGSILSGMIPDPTALRAVLDDNHYPSECSFYSREATDEDSGQQTYAYTIMDNDHQGVKCRLSPLIQIRPQTQQSNLQDIHRIDAKWQLNILHHFTDIQVEYQVEVGGTRYRITAIEPDGNGLTMRFMLNDTEPFGEG